MVIRSLLDEVIDRALHEDLAGGDLTTEATIPPETRAIARAIARKPLVVCGADVFARTFYRIDPGLRVEERIPDGTRAKKDNVIWVVEGSARSILMGERTALNFVQRMSGIATLAQSYVDALPPARKLALPIPGRPLPACALSSARPFARAAPTIIATRWAPP